MLDLSGKKRGEESHPRTRSSLNLDAFLHVIGCKKESVIDDRCFLSRAKWRTTYLFFLLFLLLRFAACLSRSRISKLGRRFSVGRAANVNRFEFTAHINALSTRTCPIGSCVWQLFFFRWLHTVFCCTQVFFISLLFILYGKIWLSSGVFFRSCRSFENFLIIFSNSNIFTIKSFWDKIFLNLIFTLFEQ